MISQKTARKIWACHEEINNAQKLLKHIQENTAMGKDPCPKDSFGSRNAFQLSVPQMGCTNSREILNVSPALAASAILDHLKKQREELETLNKIAHAEIEAPFDESESQS